uniref:Uncharacterized protein n=1 Tax=viral metagenome TaxID=1070528 RepID=A0A6M3KUJ4_9ZZZZ
MIRALFKFATIPELVEGKKPVVIDTTSSSGDFRELSPFILRVPYRGQSVIFENLWQYSKVYKKQTLAIDGYPDASWYKWSEQGMAQDRAVRYPVGKGAIPEYSFWDDEKLGYIEARKRIYAPIYAENVENMGGYSRLKVLYAQCCKDGRELILLDYDAPRNFATEGLSVLQAINNPKQKMGHAFVLIMMLVGMLEECLEVKSPSGVEENE